MAYYLKKTTLKGRTYLSIDESFYDHKRKGTAHRCYKSLGSVETLKSKGMDNPIAFYQTEVDKLNSARKETKQVLIDKSPVRHLGYFPLKGILESLQIKKYIDLYKLTTNFDFDLYQVLSSLIYARSVHPCSKYKTFHDVLPYLFESANFSYEQLLTGLGFFGRNYEKMVELFTVQTKEKYGLETSKTYFDCTNFYFEIDREDDFRKKGPSKENRKEPLVGLGLLLDQNQIPIGMRIYPGNESEQAFLRETIDLLKSQNGITGKTVQVADKGLNCARNIYTALKNGDGYLFSKSVKMLPNKEKEWIYLDSDWKTVSDKSGKVLYRYKSCIDDFPYHFEDDEGKNVNFTIREKRLLTFNPDLQKKQLYEINRLVEKAKELRVAGAKRNEYGDSGKYVTFSSVDKNGVADNDKIVVVLNQKQIESDIKLAGYNLLVTSELKMKDSEIYETYHNLWRIEESFRIMKSDLDARPVFVQTEDNIKGHFLICYLTVLLERILQFKILDNKFCSSSIVNFIKDFKVVKTESKFVNITPASDFVFDFAKILSLPIANYFLSDSQIKSVLNCSF